MGLALKAMRWATPRRRGDSFWNRKVQSMLLYDRAEEPSVDSSKRSMWLLLGGTNLMPVLTTLVRQTDNRAVSSRRVLSRWTGWPFRTGNVLGNFQRNYLDDGGEVTRLITSRGDTGDAQQKRC